MKLGDFNIGQFMKGRESVGVDITLNQGHIQDITCIIVVEKKNNVSIKFKRCFTEIHAFCNAVPKTKPLYISVNGKGIVHKIIDNPDRKENIIEMLPGVNVAEMFVQKYELPPKSSIISLLRDTNMNDVRKVFEKKGYSILGLTAGPVSLSIVAGLLKVPDFLTVRSWRIDFANNQITGIKKVDQKHDDSTMEIGGLELSGSEIVAFGNALQFFCERELDITSPFKTVDANKEFIYRRLYEKGLKFVLPLLVLTFIINQVFLLHFRKENQELSQRMSHLKPKIEKVTYLSKQLEKRNKYLEKGGFYRQPVFAFYSDQIASTIPESISLTRMSIAPRIESIPGNDSYIFNDNIIAISGNVTASYQLSSWIAKLKGISWVSEVLIQGYSDKGQEKAEFSIELIIAI